MKKKIKRNAPFDFAHEVFQPHRCRCIHCVFDTTFYAWSRIGTYQARSCEVDAINYTPHRRAIRKLMAKVAVHIKMTFDLMMWFKQYVSLHRKMHIKPTTSLLSGEYHLSKDEKKLAAVLWQRTDLAKRVLRIQVLRKLKTWNMRNFLATVHDGDCYFHTVEAKLAMQNFVGGGRIRLRRVTL